ncbi:asparaginase [Hoeflea prorocentri]|uniref:Asparaginase n=1 Tax=Hoeflea prorocentri TaxID=1922333 RepID=A0A9X3ZIB9_9HYPH|nr:asparaginase [Hoeflea prorocentri]MCY6381570.1 asparaginase [Hoeflea prorocentri]MDA5399370.1 asparaginase [Hoeflea prorocentri]
MTNPVVVEITRGGRVESRHRGSALAVDADGKTLFSVGNVDQPVFPRSAVKAMQALALVESGAADALGFGDRELALACASHSGEPRHAALAADMLKATGKDKSALECGCHWPMSQDAMIDLARSGSEPSQLHNNCSGKHAGFVCAACHLGVDPTGYVNYDHPIQIMIREILADLTSDHFGVDNCGTDGCSIPTYAVPLTSLAAGFAKMNAGQGLGPVRARAARRLIDACMARPYYVAGSKRTCTRLMETLPGRIFAKTGAEGVFCAVLPQEGISIAVKCDDGAKRAVDAVVTALVARFLDTDDMVREKLLVQANRTLKNWNRIEVGTIAVTNALS